MSSIDITLAAEQLEGTVATLSKWLIDIGQQVNAGDPLIELETDKVSMAICAPETGILRDIITCEGEEITLDTVLGHLETLPLNQKPSAVITDQNTVSEAVDNRIDDTTQALRSVNQLWAIAGENSAHDLIGPAARRLLTSHRLDLNRINGSGRRGRVTRNDVLDYIAHMSMSATMSENRSENRSAHRSATLSGQSTTVRPLKGTMVAHTRMRKAIANHMVKSLLETSPHVTSIFEMDMSNIIEHRKWHKKAYAQCEVNLTFTAYFLAAVVKAAQAVPQVNARFHDHGLELFRDINIGVGTALGDAGLVVPVVQQVQSLNLFGIAKALTIQTIKARNGTLNASDIKNGTFSISNHGVSGSLIATPIIINQPEVAILGVGKLEKRVVVETVNGADTMVIRPKCYVSLSIDHRALDAHQTNLFLAAFVDVIETWGESCLPLTP